ncbi:MAG: hypothetical protein MUF54_24510 [Polyangiaceae bacterium]|nr:hypothetical protein [Polyangiaceae bacterium]
MTHPSPKSAFDAYPSFPWEIACGAVAQLRIELPPFKPPADADSDDDVEPDDGDDDAFTMDGNLAKVIPFRKRAP